MENKMTDAEVIAILVKENFELKNLLGIINKDSIRINCLLHNIGAPLNDNVLNFNNKQLKLLFEIDALNNDIEITSKLDKQQVM